MSNAFYWQGNSTGTQPTEGSMSLVGSSWSSQSYSDSVAGAPALSLTIYGFALCDFNSFQELTAYSLTVSVSQTFDPGNVGVKSCTILVQYSDNSTDGNNGTWVTIATHNLTINVAGGGGPTTFSGSGLTYVGKMTRFRVADTAKCAVSPLSATISVTAFTLTSSAVASDYVWTKDSSNPSFSSMIPTPFLNDFSPGDQTTWESKTLAAGVRTTIYLAGAHDFGELRTLNSYQATYRKNQSGGTAFAMSVQIDISSNGTTWVTVQTFTTTDNSFHTSSSSDGSGSSFRYIRALLFVDVPAGQTTTIYLSDFRIDASIPFVDFGANITFNIGLDLASYMLASLSFDLALSAIMGIVAVDLWRRDCTPENVAFAQEIESGNYFAQRVDENNSSWGQESP